MTHYSAGSDALRVRFGEFELDEANALLLRDGNAIPLAPRPFGLLCALIRQPGSLLTKDSLLDQAWGHRFVSDSVLKTAVSDLRAVLADDVRSPRYIETVARRGYRFIAATSVLSVAAEPPAAESLVAETADVDGSRGRVFVGRSMELARLHAAWDGATRGKPAIVWVAGEPGIGKTALIEQFVAGLSNVACARGQCIEHYGTGEPYLPLLEALGHLCRVDASVAPLLSAVAPIWLLQLPWLSTAEERENLRRKLVGVSPDRMLREMGEFLDRYTEQRPLLLVTEDLHWGDRATVQLIDHMARRRGNGRLMWLASFRVADVIASDHPLKAVRNELRLHGLCEELSLEPFSEQEVADYVVHRVPSVAVSETFVRALHERTDGLPLFLAQAVDDLIARKAFGDRVSSLELLRIAIPENLAQIVDHYVARLTNEHRVVLEAAAVCGVGFRVATVAATLGRDPAAVAAICDDVARGQLWLTAPAQDPTHAPTLPYAFRHSLFREVLYGRIGPLARVELHRKVGTTLERERAAGLPVTAAELAMHFDRGRAPMVALRYYAEGAENALLNLNPVQCMSLTERALTLLDRAPSCAERTSLEVTLAALRGVSAFHVLGAGEETKIALQRACALIAEDPTHSMRSLVLHGLGFLLSVRGEYAEALVTADRAEALASQIGDPFLQLAACTMRGHVAMVQGRPDAGRKVLERALPAIEAAAAVFERRFIADPYVTLLAVLTLHLVHLGLVTQAHERLRQAYARARQLGQPMALMVTIWADALLHVRLGDVDRVEIVADEMRALVDKFELAQGKPACRYFRGWADSRKGKALEGFRQIRGAIDENVALGMVQGASENLGYAAEALLLHGDWQAAQEQLDQALEIVETYGERIYLPQLLLIESAIARARGEPAAAVASIRRAIDEARGQGATWLELLALTELGERGAANAEDRRALAALVDQLEEANDTTALARARALVAAGFAA
jgi:DNA-binding winged helix-turn-helix (wHTH) protein/tetratricopeptide (TPR) repeat protein